MPFFEKRVIETNYDVDEDSPIGRPASMTGGVLPMDTDGPMGEERYRLSVGMTDEDRQLRKQWLKDQMVAETEPIHIPGLYEARYNPLRRFFNIPSHTVEQYLVPRIGEHAVIAKGIMKGLFGIVCFGYFLRHYSLYHTYDWEKGRHGWKMYTSKPWKLPGDPGYSDQHIPAKDDYADWGFKQADARVTGYVAPDPNAEPVKPFPSPYPEAKNLPVHKIWF